MRLALLSSAALLFIVPVAAHASGGDPAEPYYASRDSENYERALQCLTQAVYYEAGNQTDDGERAVAQVVLNRVRHPAFPNTVCGVVYQGSERRTGCQFTFTCDGSLNRPASASGWDRAGRIAAAALAGEVYRPVGLATNYHANYVHPYWASSLIMQTQVGAHIFYRIPGAGEQAFTQAASDDEPEVGVAPRFSYGARSYGGGGARAAVAHDGFAVENHVRVYRGSETNLARTVNQALATLPSDGPTIGGRSVAAVSRNSLSPRMVSVVRAVAHVDRPHMLLPRTFTQGGVRVHHGSEPTQLADNAS